MSISRDSTGANWRPGAFDIADDPDGLPSPVMSPENPADLADAYDAFLLVSFGGPERPEDVMPFLERVTAGRSIPPERLQVVANAYLERGGVSPINAQCRDLLRRVADAFTSAGIDLPIYWGNRNSPPFLDETVSQMRDDGVRRALAFVTSAYSSYSGCRQYLENIAAARQRAGEDAPLIEKLRVFFNHPGFIEPMVDGLTAALDELGLARSDVHVLFTAHSIPTSFATRSFYVEQLRSAAGLVAERVASMPAWSLVWQSRSGPPSVPWLEPDVCEAIDKIEGRGVVVVPVGFVSDHMEVVQDLDIAAAAAAAAAGLAFSRVSTSSSDPRFVELIVDLVRERVDGVTPVALGDLGLVPEQCDSTCCLPPG